MKTLPYYLKVNIENLAKSQANEFYNTVLPAMDTHEVLNLLNMLRYDNSYFAKNLSMFVDLDKYRQVVSNILSRLKNGNYDDYVDDIKLVLKTAYMRTIIPKLESLQENLQEKGMITLCDKMMSFLENI